MAKAVSIVSVDAATTAYYTNQVAATTSIATAITANTAAIVADTTFTDTLITITKVAAATYFVGEMVTQLDDFYSKASTANANRDGYLQDQMDFMQDLDTYRDTQDLPMLLNKQSVLTSISPPTPGMCFDASLFQSDIELDGDAIDAKSQQISTETYGGLPLGWVNRGGELLSAKASSYVTGIIPNEAKRREEDFRNTHTKLIRAGQQGMKAGYTSSEILTKYSQAANIQGGLADLFMQGFNSAGAALGTILGKLGGSS